MNNRATGVCFCALAVPLFLSRFVIAMLYRGFNPTRWGADDFAEAVRFVSIGPWIAAGVALLIGAAYLIRGWRE